MRNTPFSGIRTPAAFEGVPAQAVVAWSEPASGVYYISEVAPARLLKWASTRDGRQSSRTYVDFGKETSVILPEADGFLTTEEFLKEISAD